MMGMNAIESLFGMCSRSQSQTGKFSKTMQTAQDCIPSLKELRLNAKFSSRTYVSSVEVEP